MPRSPRIEYEGAVYHVMARGNRGEPIVFDDRDRELFVATFGEACIKTGWEVFAWVLMDNHYHAVFRTPHGNLVEGMKWFQNTYTRRLNSRRRLWGHLFGGRYRSILIENKDHGGSLWRDYLRTAVDYVHLNPARAGLVDGVDKKAFDYKWSSLGSAYKVPPSRRPQWMAVAETLDLFQERDTVAGRRNFVGRIDEWIRAESGEPSVEGADFQDRINRGWFWGTNKFKESMLQLLETSLNVKKPRDGSNRTYQSSEALKDRGEKRAAMILNKAKKHFDLSSQQLKLVVRKDLTRASIAARLYGETTVSQDWIAEKLGMKSAANVCQQIRKFKSIKKSQLRKKVRTWMKINIF